ncbi:dimethylarginine dimethylaminohydrolase family protein [Bacillus suaedae]|uniref:Dimethylarginine dimethylaminohydrolase family protein n=1 Tax=Halalkalibacter suaedae TaxID=2822140 RepID=A0A940WXY5_9BACI|nr:dimethylarginine dimethylaminohydrolase family protein [Bacillus suaedae]MBP3950406.1 dimethylarginine dimethylaminohydrolase family protein [Bacillus suaedae]
MSSFKPFSQTEYATLEQVVLCEPKFMTIRDVINETQKKFKDEGIHIELAMRQHKEFVKQLKKHGVDVVLLSPVKLFPEQVFTRDIGFTIGHTIFVAEMAHKIRQGEEDLLKSWLKNEKLSYYNLIGDMIEGGDVVIDGDKIFVGLSNRTNQNAIDHLKRIMPEKEVITIPFTEKYLHLDCVFNIISPTEALYFPGAFTKKELDVLRTHYDLIEVSEEEQFTLGTNVLSIGDKKIFSLPVNNNVNKELTKRGYTVIEVDITEIIKSGGSFRCCTLPVKRSAQ